MQKKTDPGVNLEDRPVEKTVAIPYQKSIRENSGELSRLHKFHVFSTENLGFLPNRYVQMVLVVETNNDM